LEGLDLASGFNEMAESFDHLMVVNQAKIRSDPFDFNLDDLPCQTQILPEALEP
jgi:hypothetical protein